MIGMLPWVVVDGPNGIAFYGEWGTWLFLCFILALNVYIFISQRGYSITGFTKEEIETFLVEWLRAQSYFVSSRIGEKKLRQRTVKQATIISVRMYDTDEEIWMTGRKREVSIFADSARGKDLVNQFFSALRNRSIQYIFKYHASGIIYLVIGVGALVFGWVKYLRP